MVVVTVLVIDTSDEFSAVVKTTASSCDIVVSDSVPAVIGAVISAFGAAAFLLTSSAGTVKVAVGGGGVVVEAIVCERALVLLSATDWCLMAALVELVANRLDTALQRCPPQHRIIQLRALCASGNKFSGLKALFFFF